MVIIFCECPGGKGGWEGKEANMGPGQPCCVWAEAGVGLPTDGWRNRECGKDRGFGSRADACDMKDAMHMEV
jgi:hypothetical protein